MPAFAASPYLSRVYDYCPAPGQFINELPEYEAGDTRATILEMAYPTMSGGSLPAANMPSPKPSTIIKSPTISLMMTMWLIPTPQTRLSPTANMCDGPQTTPMSRKATFRK